MSQGSEADEQMPREALKQSQEAVKHSAMGAKNLEALCLAMVFPIREMLRIILILRWSPIISAIPCDVQRRP